jgi:hypothetical protein
VFKQNDDGSFESYRGAPQPEWFKLPSTGVASFDTYLQLDYVFSMMRASYALPAAP